MKILLAYYSRSGTTKTLADYLVKNLNSDLLEIKTPDNRNGLTGYLKSGKEALKKEMPPINKFEINISDYDLVLVGTPVWVGTMASPVRTFMFENKSKFKNVAFFSTQGSVNNQKIFEEMESLINIKPKDKLFTTNKEIKQKSFQNKTDIFIKNLI